MFDCYNLKDCNECCCQVKPSIFFSLSKEDKSVLYKDRHEIEFKQGETIFKQNTALTHIACIKEGFVKMSTEANHSKNYLMKICQPGDTFGSMGLYAEEVHQATCTAITNVKCCLIDVGSFKETLQKNNRFAIDLIKNINTNAIQSKNRTVNLTSKSMYSRVADMLLYLSSSVYKSNKFTTTLKRQDMADLCALTKESMIRILKEFKESKIISIDNNSFEIYNEQELKKISVFN